MHLVSVVVYGRNRKSSKNINLWGLFIFDILGGGLFKGRAYSRG